MKYLIKKLLDKIIEMVNKYAVKQIIKTDLQYIIYASEYRHTFFGYYDITPFNYNSTKLLAMSTEHNDKLTSAKKALVGYFNIGSNKFNKIDETTTWCWQQGCRMMWFNNTAFIYNKVINNDYGSVVYDLETNEKIAEYNFAIYDKTKDNKLALSLNFSRLHYFRPGYGYCNFINDEDKKKILETDGIYLCSFENNTKELLISLPTIIGIENDERMNNADHYINHLKFSPDNKTFLFYHIWNKNNRRYTRAMLASIDGKILDVLDNQTFMSHYAFKNSNEILIYTNTGQNGHHLYNLTSRKYAIINEQLQEDGHQTYLDNGNFLTDSYPDKIFRNQKIMIFNNSQFKVLSKIYSPIKYQGEFRCDLHPRLNHDNTLISIDMPTISGRQMIVFDLAENKFHD